MKDVVNFRGGIQYFEHWRRTRQITTKHIFVSTCTSYLGFFNGDPPFIACIPWVRLQGFGSPQYARGGSLTDTEGPALHGQTIFPCPSHHRPLHPLPNIHFIHTHPLHPPSMPTILMYSLISVILNSNLCVSLYVFYATQFFLYLNWSSLLTNGNCPINQAKICQISILTFCKM